MDYENKRPPYHPPKPPHPPHPPKPEPVKFQSINTVLTKKVNNTIYELMVRTTTDQVLDKNGVTVTEQLSNIFDLLTTKYEIAPERLIIKSEVVQKAAKPELSRAVVISF